MSSLVLNGLGPVPYSLVETLVVRSACKRRHLYPKLDIFLTLVGEDGEINPAGWAKVKPEVSFNRLSKNLFRKTIRPVKLPHAIMDIQPEWRLSPLMQTFA
ncbi:MAG: hypothetical protein ACTHJ8_17730 [Mucilaginibacter sp.]